MSLLRCSMDGMCPKLVLTRHEGGMEESCLWALGTNLPHSFEVYHHLYWGPGMDPEPTFYIIPDPDPFLTLLTMPSKK
jgi:hypothetical protein